MLNGILWDRHIKKETKINIYKTIVRSVLTYGTETWILNKKIKSKLASTEMDFLRRSSRHSKLEKVRNIEIRRQMNYQESIIDYIQRKQLSWYGHVKRMDDSRIPRRLLDWVPEGRRRRGRPGTWTSGIAEAMRQRHLEEGEWEDR